MPRQGSKPGPGGAFFRRWGCHGYLCRDCAPGGSMDRSALIRWLAVCLLLVSLRAQAVVYVFVQEQQYYMAGVNKNFPDADSACMAELVRQQGNSSTFSHSVPGVTVNGQKFGQCFNKAGSNYSTATGNCPSPPNPPGNPQPGMPACWDQKLACPAGQTADAQGFCQVVCPGFGTTTGTRDSQLTTTKSGSDVVCLSGCQYIPTVAAQQPDGMWARWGPFTSLGLKCTGSEAGNGSPAPATCPPAQCPGSVNGTSVCMPCTDVREPPKTTDTTAPPADAGSAPAGATPGSTSTTEQTSCTGGQCTTTRTTTTVGSSGGQTSQTSTTTQPIGTYCSVNPGAAVCSGLAEGQEEEPSTWGGSCAGFQCGGDAIQCAIAREQHTRNCALFDQQTDLSRAGYTAASGDDPADHPRKNAQTVAFGLSTMLDTTPVFGGSGGCPSDFTFVYAGQTLTIPFSQACPALHMMGTIWMGLCYLMAATIVFYRR